jgi:predicted transcriptional regulator
MADTSNHYVENLEKEKAALEARIVELQNEVRAINNLIYRYKSQNIAKAKGESVNLKNIDRIFFESMIIDALRSSKNGLRTREIYESLRRSGYNVNYNTVRSYVTRMRDRGSIRKKSKGSYNWTSV